MCDSDFTVCQIMFPITKYHHCMEDAVNNYAAFTNPYTELKQ